MKVDVLIVGAGFAGGSTAFHLSRNFGGSILIIEKEQVPGAHASGKNASLLLQGAQLPEIRRALAASREAYSRHQSELGYKSCGSVLIGRHDQLEGSRQADLFHSEYLDAESVRREIPLLHGHQFESALSTPSDGVVDIAALLQYYLANAQSRGVELWLDCEVKTIHRENNFRVETSQGTLEARFIINAAGAWAPQVAQMAKAAPLPLASFKRHLFLLTEIPELNPEWPFVWSFEQNYYFRYQSGDLLFSLCDEGRSEGGLEPLVDPEVSELLAELIWKQLPALREAVQKKVWSCFRTKAPDGRFVIGWDPLQDDFFWVAALGGHGMGASWEAGRLAAEKFQRPEIGPDKPFDPARFQRSVAPAH
ncbi:MAG: NAD(P)/FAD-dependent oxidoreductase [Acidobacteriota bacterium]